jgi:hypothetical protein
MADMGCIHRLSSLFYFGIRVTKGVDMGIVRIPYRWLPRTIWPNLRSCYWDVHYGIKNIFRWIPVIWHDRDFDWAFLADVMEYKLRRLSKTLEDGHHVGGKHEARRALICAILLKRLREDNYWKDKRSNEVERAQFDQELCFKIMGKHFREWWE